jgi:hypothetical protein
MAVHAFKVFGFLVCDEDFFVVKLAVAIPTPWLVRYVLPLLGHLTTIKCTVDAVTMAAFPAGPGYMNL